jgi:hypothetical protein
MDLIASSNSSWTTQAIVVLDGWVKGVKNMENLT